MAREVSLSCKGPHTSRVEYLLAIPLLAFAVWLKFRPFRNGRFSELYGAPSDEDLAEAGLPPRESHAATQKQPTKRLFGPFPEDDQTTPDRKPAVRRQERDSM